MAKKPDNTTTLRPKPVEIRLDEVEPDTLRAIGGSRSHKFNSTRPQLARALAICRGHRATLLIAKLDRLARNVHFISGLMETGVPFVAADMSTATPFMLHIYAAMAEAEGIAISTRTKAALAAAEARGAKLGKPPAAGRQPGPGAHGKPRQSPRRPRRGRRTSSR